MLTTTPYLTTRRPSPTTAEFTLTTCPPLTPPLRAALFGVLCLRFIAVLSVIIGIYSAFFSPPSNPPPPVFPSGRYYDFDLNNFLLHILHLLYISAPGQWVATLATSVLPPYAVLGLSAVTAYIALFARIHTTESLLVLRGLGIQMSSSVGGGNFFRLGGGTYMKRTRFIPTEKIQDILINEAFKGFEVRYYLVIVVEGEEDVVVCFPRLLPRRKIAEKVWREARGCLYEKDGPVMGAGAGSQAAWRGGNEKGG
ncbi:GPI-GlcNAc transferase complex, PIG-H component-domain-containing protein [Sordaria brevicollis]|uniref:GPI-GlcNAc transferase complex, PIG-H component-domain-containing protein n=1 Tax=Sordaria brevicollis TaxID=83679 RepID=A0AAE0PD12_SORBR|nr:GPI-GlcNAc transferase complex, PIG-H component-domain-containing protein [Sordaria brevicollis]